MHKQEFLVYHVIRPKSMVDPSKADYRSMPFESVYYEDDGDSNTLLRVSGYRGKPFVAPRWVAIGSNTYGDCPGNDALGDAKMLQKLEKDKLIALEKHVNPAMNAPTALKQAGGTVIPGGVNYFDTTQGQQGFQPVYQTTFDINSVAAEIERVEARIRRYFFNDLFLAILGTTDNKERTATEIARAFEEKIMLLGPVIEILQSEMYDDQLDRLYNIMDSFGLLPEPPQELIGREIRMEYIGVLAQAQRMIGVRSIIETTNYVGALAELAPEVLAKFDAMQALDEYTQANGTAPNIIRSDQDAQDIIAAQRQIQQANAGVEQVERLANAAKTASETQVEGESVLDRAAGQQRRAS